MRKGLFRGLLALCLCLAVQPAVAAPVDASPSDRLVLDPAVRTGKLPNGMGFVLRRNATPPGEISIRLRIGTGSLNETNSQRGVAHLLEHLVLNGTRNVPEGEFTRRSERLGLRLGADSNATTDWQQTVYRFDLPRSDPDSVGTALFLLREIADRATLDPGALDRERGVILAEERARATPTQRSGQEALAWHFRGQLISDRHPIGTVESIRTVPREQVLAFYNQWYRPDNATLIVVGDIDPQLIEARIRTEFGDWKADSPAGKRPDQGRPETRSTQQNVVVNASVPQSLSVSWLRPTDLRSDSRTRRIESLHERIVLNILNRRLQHLAQQETGAPFTAAAARSSRLADSGDMTQLNLQARGGDWRGGLRVLEQEQRRLVQFGASQAEIDRTLIALRTSLQTLVRGGQTLPSRALADLLLAQVNESLTPISPEAQLALFEDAVRGLQPASLKDATQRLFSGSGPLLYLTTGRPLATGTPGPADVWTTSLAQAVQPRADEVAVAWPYETLGTPGRIEERRNFSALGTTSVRFANGVQLLIRPSTARKEQVLIRAYFGSGRLALTPDRPSHEWAFASALIGGGTVRLSTEELQRSLTGKITGLSLGTEDDSFFLSGGTRSEDLATQLQLMAAFLKEPGWRRSGFERTRANAAQIHQTAAATPSGVLSRDLDFILHSGDPRYRLPALRAMLATRPEDVRAVLEPALAEGPMEVVIAGDVEVEEAIRQVAATFGALPTRGLARRTVAAPTFPAAQATPIGLFHNGRADQAMAVVAWPTFGLFGDLQRSRVLSVLAAVLQQRMTERLREEMGSTYVPFARHLPSKAFESYGYLLAGSEAPLDKLADVRAVFRQIAAELAAKPVDADELERALRPLLLNFDRERAGNEYWLGALEGLSSDPRVEKMIASRSDAYRAITAADLQSAAREYLKDERALRVEVLAKPKIAVPDKPPVIVTPSDKPALPTAKPPL